MSVMQSQHSRFSSPVHDKSADSPYWRQATSLELNPTAEAPVRARRHVLAVLPKWGLPPELIRDAVQVATELSDDALRATLALAVPEPTGLRLLCDRRRVVIEVWDCGPDAGRRPVLNGVLGDGRGPRIVERLANQWGSQRVSANVKTVWAELLVSTYLDSSPESGHTSVDTPQRPRWPSADWSTQITDVSAFRPGFTAAR
jgi:anti-sigma regulatory factor (Ser/Thr protein kinase)